MGQQCGGIEEIAFRQIILCPDICRVIAAHGEEQLMVNGQVRDGYFISPDLIVLYDVLFYLFGDRNDPIRGFSAQIDDGLEKKKIKAGEILRLIDMLKIVNNENRWNRAEERRRHPG
jgi:hypothetical protein